MGCGEQTVCGGGAMEGSIFFFSWKVHDSDSSGALGGWLRWETAGERATEGGTSEKIAGARTAGCAVVAHLRTGQATRCWRLKVQGLEDHEAHSLPRSSVWYGTLHGHPEYQNPATRTQWHSLELRISDSTRHSPQLHRPVLQTGTHMLGVSPV